MRVRQFRTSIEAKVYVTGVGIDVAEGISWASGQLEDDDLGVDGVQHFLCLGCLSQHQFTQRKRQLCHAGGTSREEIEEFRAGFSHVSLLM